MTNKNDGKTRKRRTSQPATDPWDAALDKVREWEPPWARAGARKSTNPWTSGILSPKLVELISVAVNAACTNLNPKGIRRHIRAALAAGATLEEIMEVLKLCVAQGVQACKLGVPILEAEIANRSAGDDKPDITGLSPVQQAELTARTVASM